jgi:16S rRNA (cytidine1402-2'-O)-methyltransferase
MSGTLFVVATPIGNLDDITFRAIETLKQVDIIAAEDTRVTGRLLKKFDIQTPLQSYREQNSKKLVPRIIEQLQNDRDVAVVSDAGTPSISDPGFELIEAAHNNNITVSPIPGASALCASLSSAALPGDGARFIGFLPRKGKNRKERLLTVAQDPSVSIIYESPHRLHRTLTDLADVCGNRLGVVARELTKLHQEIKRAPLSTLAALFAQNNRGEIVIIVEGNPAASREDLSSEDLATIVADEIKKGRSAKDISSSLSAALGVKKKKIYDITVKMLSDKKN